MGKSWGAEEWQWAGEGREPEVGFAHELHHAANQAVWHQNSPVAALPDAFLQQKAGWSWDSLLWEQEEATSPALTEP